MVALFSLFTALCSLEERWVTASWDRVIRGSGLVCRSAVTARHVICSRLLAVCTVCSGCEWLFSLNAAGLCVEHCVRTVTRSMSCNGCTWQLIDDSFWLVPCYTFGTAYSVTQTMLVTAGDGCTLSSNSCNLGFDYGLVAATGTLGAMWAFVRCVPMLCHNDNCVELLGNNSFLCWQTEAPRFFLQCARDA